ncbi:MAG: hypothetical protein FWD48_03245 [Oscillospiraceae bacterium]|nr:hypothetical protein [Oscillospiraceae bacterium]
MAKADINKILTQPNNYRVVVKDRIAEITGGNLFDCESSNPAIASVSITGGSARVTGKKAGTAAIALGSNRGIVTVYNYQVSDPDLIKEYTLKQGGEVLFGDVGETKASPVSVLPASAYNTIAWESLDTDIVTAAQNGNITATGKGSAIVLGRFTDTWGVERDVHILATAGECKYDCPDCDGGGDEDKPISDKPDASDGDKLDTAHTGDSEDWFEIARNGDYSLIMRSKFISTYDGHYDDPAWQNTDYGTTNVYRDSRVRRAINAWWNGTAPGVADKLPAGARVRQFTMQNDAVNVLGTGDRDSGGLENGFSKPSRTSIPSGSEDVAFALSFTEAANFISKSYSTNGTGATQNSNTIAVRNFEKLIMPADKPYGFWLRTPSETVSAGGAVDLTGRAFQFHISSANEQGLVYPALWVKTAIFNF